MESSEKIFAKHLFLNLSDACNLHCDVCYGHLTVGRQQHMDLETAKLATEFYYNNRNIGYNQYYIMFFGGEPLLNFDIIEPYLAWFREVYNTFDCRFFLFTNGVLLDGPKADFLIKNSVDIFISFDNDREYYTRIKTGIAPYYEQIEERIASIARKNPKAIIPYYIIHTGDLTKLDEFCHHMKRLGVKKFAVTREIFTAWSDSDKQNTENILKKHRLDFDEIYVYPEIAASCSDCYPQNIMVYPDGEVYDLCLVCGSSLYRQSYCGIESLQKFRMGNIVSEKSPHLNISEKYNLIHDSNRNDINSHCPTLNPELGKIKYLWDKQNDS